MPKALVLAAILAMAIAAGGATPVAKPDDGKPFAPLVDAGVAHKLKQQAVARYVELTRTQANRSPFLRPVYYASMIGWIIIEAAAGICFFLAYRHLKKLRQNGAL